MQMSTVTCLVYNLSKKLLFVPVASATTAIHRDCLILTSNAQWPEIQPLVSQGQIISAVTDGRTEMDRRTNVILV